MWGDVGEADDSPAVAYESSGDRTTGWSTILSLLLLQLDTSIHLQVHIFKCWQPMRATSLPMLE